MSDLSNSPRNLGRVDSRITLEEVVEEVVEEVEMDSMTMDSTKEMTVRYGQQ